ncbi:MAG: radical SAM protein [Nitrospirota bacterium]|jgi:7-carboxy-7-deazaguanine synthase
MRITEIFHSLQGESTFAGLPCAFVRTTGCNLRCSYCDTAYAFHGGREMSVDDVLAEVAAMGTGLVEVTGGEPLLQPESIDLMAGLLARGHTVLLETGGSLSIDAVPAGVHVILDIKTPSSGEADANEWGNIARLDDRGQIKLVIGDRRDFDWSIEVIREHRLIDRWPVLLSPVHGAVAAADAAAWILASGLPFRLQLQLHKYVWDPARTGV